MTPQELAAMRVGQLRTEADYYRKLGDHGETVCFLLDAADLIEEQDAKLTATEAELERFKRLADHQHDLYMREAIKLVAIRPAIEEVRAFYDIQRGDDDEAAKAFDRLDAIVARIIDGGESDG